MNDLHGMGTAAYALAGHELLRVKETGLYKLGKFTSFDKWLKAETKVSRSTAYEMMKIAKTFSVEEIKHFGTAMLSQIRRMPCHTYSKLLADVTRNQLTTRAMKKKVDEHKTSKKTPRERHEARAANTRAKNASAEAAKAQAETAASRPTDKISICVTSKLHTVKLFKKPSTFKDVRDKKHDRATLTKHGPWGKLELANETTMLFSVALVDGALVALIRFERDSEEPTP